MISFNALESADTLVKDYANSLSSPQVKLELMEGCGHSPQVQLPQEFSLLIKIFLNNL